MVVRQDRISIRRAKEDAAPPTRQKYRKKGVD